MADEYVHIHIQLNYFGLTSSEECVKQLFCFFDI